MYVMFHGGEYEVGRVLGYSAMSCTEDGGCKHLWNIGKRLPDTHLHLSEPSLSWWCIVVYIRIVRYNLKISLHRHVCKLSHTEQNL